MVTIRWKILALDEAAPLCATCIWGLVRKGFRAAEAESICRLVAPNSVVPFRMKECNEYVDRRVPDRAAHKRIGFTSTGPLPESEEVEIVSASSRSSDT